MSPLVTRLFPKLPGRRRMTQKSMYCRLSPTGLDVFGTVPDRGTVVNIILSHGLNTAGLLRAADNALHSLGMEVVGGWRTPLDEGGTLVATAAVRRIPTPD